LNAFLGVPGIQLPDEQHDLSASRENLLDEFSRLSTGRDVIRPHVTCPIALRSIAILRKDQSLSRSVVDKGSLILRIDWGNSDTADASSQQIVDDPFLFGSCAIRSDFEIGCNVIQFGIRFFDSLTRYRPEIGRIVGHKGQLQLFRSIVATAGFAGQQGQRNENR
jgi:hypothetical protein